MECKVYAGHHTGAVDAHNCRLTVLRVITTSRRPMRICTEKLASPHRLIKDPWRQHLYKLRPGFWVPCHGAHDYDTPAEFVEQQTSWRLQTSARWRSEGRYIGTKGSEEITAVIFSTLIRSPWRRWQQAAQKHSAHPRRLKSSSAHFLEPYISVDKLLQPQNLLSLDK